SPGRLTARLAIRIGLRRALVGARELAPAVDPGLAAPRTVIGAAPRRAVAAVLPGGVARSALRRFDEHAFLARDEFGGRRSLHGVGELAGDRSRDSHERVLRTDAYTNPLH